MNRNINHNKMTHNNEYIDYLCSPKIKSELEEKYISLTHPTFWVC